MAFVSLVDRCFSHLCASPDPWLSKPHQMQHPVMTNADIIYNLVEFVDHSRYLFFASVSRAWHTAWGKRPTATSYASSHSSLSQLLHSFECGLPRSAKVCTAIACVGNLELLQCARDHGCRWEWSTRREVALAGHLHVLKWARETGFSGTSIRARDLHGGVLG